ncbi:unnamed protein product [Phaedon cochleariae]|uniref:Grh/CP2 DB domain-containing protein n=1 Tax=Phaedon cochleariae TaxID=80249 RepID=A0A9P0DTP7_PHACE|nr:unnamed protein product [Phaedon cochleariae]
MDYQLYEHPEILLSDNSDNSKGSWNVDHQGDIFGGWKIDEGVSGGKGGKKRRLSGSDGGNGGKQMYRMGKDPLSVEAKVDMKKENVQNGICFFPGSGKLHSHWQVEDYTDLNTDIDSSLSLGGSDLVNNPYTVSDNLLSINGLTVFKQEAPSPTAETTALSGAGPRDRPQRSPAAAHPQAGAAGHGAGAEDTSSQTMFSNTISQLLSQSGLVGLQNVIDGNSLSSPTSQDSYVVSSTSYHPIDDTRFQYVLAAATSIATKRNEDTLTYLNQGQSYEIKLKKLGDLSFYRGKLLKSVIRICFHERRLQYTEKEQMLSWQKARPGDRILEADVPLSYGAYDVIQPAAALNVVSFSWDPTKEVGVYIKVNCISTEFTPKKHGGEKGVPFRVQVETYPQHAEFGGSPKLLHAAACQIKVFKLKGAERKHKQDREKVLRRPQTEQEKFQASCDCTVLNDLPGDALSSASPSPTPVHIENNVESNHQIQNILVPRNENVEVPNSVSPRNPIPLPQEKPEVATQLDITSTQLNEHFSPEETTHWLTANRFDKYVETFERFSGDDMLRMSKEDLIQICGDADGIRLHNAIHLKTIAPKLKIYVRPDDPAAVFTAIFLSSHSRLELTRKLAAVAGVPQTRVRDVHVEGPHGVRVHLSDDLLRHVRHEAMFQLQREEEEKGDEGMGGCVLLLKRFK